MDPNFFAHASFSLYVWLKRWDVMQWNIVLFLIKVCHVERLPYVLYGIWRQYNADISANLDYYYVRLTAFFSRTTWVSQAGTRKENHSEFYWIKRRWGGSGISWTICKSFASHSRQITTPVPHHSVFRGRMPFLPLNQQHQSTEGSQPS